MALAAFVAACSGGGGGGGNTPTTPVDNSVARIDVSPSAAVTLASGGTVTLTATAFTHDGRSLGSAGLSWSSSNDGIASVSGGVVTAKLVGSVAITATSGTISSPGVSVTVTPGAAAQLGVRTQPDGAASGAPMTTQPVVEVRDAAGNLVPSSATVTVALASGGGALGGTAAANANAGVATFSGLAITGVVGARTLAFTSPGLAGATSASFSLAPGDPAALAIRTQPVAGTAYAPFTTPAVVEIRDAAGNVTNSTATVTATIASGGGALGGITAVSATAGVATFTSLTVNGTAGARTLTFGSGALAAVTTASFNVTAAPPAVIAFAPSPATVSATVGQNPATVNVTVSNSGVFPLTNLRVTGTAYNPIAPAGWLVAAFPSGTDAPATLRLTATSATLAVGTYTATVTVAGDGTTASATLTVTLVVAPATINTYGTNANKVSILNAAATLSPGLTTTVGGVATAPDPTVTYVSRSPAIATVDATGKITAVATGQTWVVALSTQSNSDSVLVIVPRSAGLILRTDMTKYNYKVGDTIVVHVLADTRGALLSAATVTLSWPLFTGNTGITGPLTYIDVTAGTSTMSPTFTLDVTAVPAASNLVRINANSVAGATGLVEIAVVRFRIARTGVGALYLNAVELLAPDLSSLLPTTTFTQYPVIVP